MIEVKTPKTKGVAKTPIVMQLEALECGAASLTMILAYYDKWVPLEQVRADCGVSRNGSNARNLLRAARKYGLDGKGYAYTTEKLREKGKFPAIIHWGMAHFVVLNGFKGNKAIINDPAKGLVKVDLKTFDEMFTGIYLELAPTENFEPGGKRKSMMEFAKKRLKGAVSLIVFFVMTTIILNLLSIVSPVLQQVFVDYILGGKNPTWLFPFVVIFGIFGLMGCFITLVQTVYGYKIRGKLDLIGSTNYMWRILRLPINFFSQRMVGDLQARQSENASIAETLVNVFAPLFFNAVMIVFYLVIMTRKSLVLTAIGILNIIINLVLSQYISNVRINISRVRSRDAAKLGAMTSKAIEMIETIKSNGAESNYYDTWAEVQNEVNEQNIKMAKLNATLGLIPSVVSLMANYGILILGVYYTLKGDFSVGSILSFQAFLSAFMAPAMTIISSGQTIMEMRTSMERVEDVLEYPLDPNVTRHIRMDKVQKVKGNIKIENLTFGYSSLDEPVLKDFSINIEEGQKIAIVGPTGSGKSTISKLLSGLYSPWSGTMLFDGKRIDEIDHEVFVGSIAVVDQDITLFEDTIANNIKMWDNSIVDFEVKMACKDAQIHDLIMAREGGYDGIVLEGGKNFSGGEKQRMEIARALAQDPSIIILDEATSALDAKTEYEAVNAIKKRGITTIVIAHRLSTIRDSDLIVVLDKGVIVEQGTHSELMKLEGFYYKLVSSE